MWVPPQAHLHTGTCPGINLGCPGSIITSSQFKEKPHFKNLEFSWLKALSDIGIQHSIPSPPPLQALPGMSPARTFLTQSPWIYYFSPTKLTQLVLWHSYSLTVFERLSRALWPKPALAWPSNSLSFKANVPANALHTVAFCFQSSSPLECSVRGTVSLGLGSVRWWWWCFFLPLKDQSSTLWKCSIMEGDSNTIPYYMN